MWEREKKDRAMDSDGRAGWRAEVAKGEAGMEPGGNSEEPPGLGMLPRASMLLREVSGGAVAETAPQRQPSFGNQRFPTMMETAPSFFRSLSNVEFQRMSSDDIAKLLSVRHLQQTGVLGWDAVASNSARLQDAEAAITSAASKVQQELASSANGSDSVPWLELWFQQIKRTQPDLFQTLSFGAAGSTAGMGGNGADGADAQGAGMRRQGGLSAQARAETAGEEDAELIVASDGSRQYRCTEPGCAKVFSRRNNLKAHMRMHTGEQPYKCPDADCGKTFKWKSCLSSHVKMHAKRGSKSGTLLATDGDELASSAATGAAMGSVSNGMTGARPPTDSKKHHASALLFLGTDDQKHSLEQDDSDTLIRLPTEVRNMARSSSNMSDLEPSPSMTGLWQAATAGSGGSPRPSASTGQDSLEKRNTMDNIFSIMNRNMAASRNVSMKASETAAASTPGKRPPAELPEPESERGGHAAKRVTRSRKSARAAPAAEDENPPSSAVTKDAPGGADDQPELHSVPSGSLLPSLSAFPGNTMFNPSFRLPSFHVSRSERANQQ